MNQKLFISEIFRRGHGDFWSPFAAINVWLRHEECIFSQMYYKSLHFHLEGNIVGCFEKLEALGENSNPIFK